MPDPGSQSPQAAPGDRPLRDPSAGGSAMAPNAPDPAGAGPWARRLLLPRTDGQADTGGGPAVLMAATTEGTGP